MRGIRLTDKFCEYVSFRLPKKTGAFVPSLYGECPDGSFAKTLDQWSSGESAPPQDVKINPELGPSIKLRVHDGSAPVNDNEEEKTTEPQIVSVAASSTAAATMQAALSAANSQNVQTPSDEMEEMKQSFEKKITMLEDQLKDKDTADDFQNDSNEEVDTLKDELDQLKGELTNSEDKISELMRQAQEKDSEIERLQMVKIKNAIAKILIISFRNLSRKNH
jgi:predicted RNase H-like nuclease (RuvC/YqgF family)